MSSADIFRKIQGWVSRERECLVEVIRGLMEIDSSGGYRELGFSSLFALCTEGLQYSAGAAHRRITAARCAASYPGVLDMIGDGRVSLTALCIAAPELTPENYRSVLDSIQGKPQREVEVLVASLKAPVVLRPEPKPARVVPVRVVRAPAAPLPLFEQEPVEPPPPVTEYTISMQVDGEFMELYREAEQLTGYPGISMQEVLRAGLKALTAKAAPPKRECPPKESNSSYIPKAVRHAVRERDGNRCTYEAPDGRRCTATHALQYDHRIPRSLGGTNSLENIRMLCPAHNQLMAEEILGVRYRKRRNFHDGSAPGAEHAA